MITLFDMDNKDYEEDWNVFARPSARAIIIKGEKVLLIYSKEYNYYKFPGGGIENRESREEALIREVHEETGYKVIPESISEFGMVTRKHKDNIYPNSIFIQENFYYLCDVEDVVEETELDDYEIDEGFTAMWMDPFEAFNVNKYANHDEKEIDVIRREERVLEMVYYYILDSIHEKKEWDLVWSLGHPEYHEMVEYVKTVLSSKNTEDIGHKTNIRYSRFEHTKRVLAWTKRLYDMAVEAGETELKFDELMIAAIFHDVGRNVGNNFPHAQAGVPLTREFLSKHGYPEDKIEYICMLVGCHSDKWRMKDRDLDRNLLLLMEADLLDDMGALGIVMDCMITQKRREDANFYDCYNHIRKYTCRLQHDNPMVTPEGKKLWDEKTKLSDEFIKALETDLAYS